ncbi:MAG: PQQ-binding-like beta-propeller repeat protein [bacterium]|nr:PQQ-binding-like beta-propeller repeat protein [bacterium]
MKKQIQLFICLVCLLPVVMSCSSIPVEYPDPVMFRGDTQHSGIYATQGVEQFSEVKWTFKTGNRIISSPAIYDGDVFIGSDDGYMYAVDMETGVEKWKFKTDGAVSSSPAVFEGIVLFGSADGNFYALDYESGREEWRFRTGGESFFSHKGLWGIQPKDQLMVDPWDFFISSPVVEDGIVYFGSGDTHIYALEIKTGIEKWRFKTEDSVHSTPAVSNGMVYCGSWDSYLYALDAESGKEIWKFDTGQDDENRLYEGVQGSPAVYNGTVYICSRSPFVFAIDAATGEKKWEYTTGGPWIPTSPATVNGVIYCGTSDGYNLLAFDAETGDMKFDFKAGAWVFSSPAITGNIAYFGCHNGRLFAVDITSGEKKWEFRTEASRLNEGNYYTEEGIINGSAYPRAADPEKVYEHMVETVNQRILSVGSIISSPVVKDGVIFFGSTDGNLYAIR